MYTNVENLAKEWNRFRALYCSNPRENWHCVLVCMALIRVSQEILDEQDYLDLLVLTESVDTRDATDSIRMQSIVIA